MYPIQQQITKPPKLLRKNLYMPQTIYKTKNKNKNKNKFEREQNPTPLVF